jgi:RIO kinase 2
MESTKGGQSDSEGEGESEEEDVEGSEGEVVEAGERAEAEEGGEHEEEPDRSAKLSQAESEEPAQASTESRSREGRSPSPVEQLANKVESTLSVKEKEIRDKAAVEAYKRRAREKQKHHSRRGTERIGRAKGSKAKQDNRVKLDNFWD